MIVQQVCQRNAVTISPTQDLGAAARLMREKHIGYLVVVVPAGREGAESAVGVLTDRDIVISVVARDVDPRSVNVGDVMTRNPRTAYLDDYLTDALAQMQSIGVRRLPVVNASGELTGVISLDDILVAMATELNQASGAIARERSQEAVRRP